MVPGKTVCTSLAIGGLAAAMVLSGSVPASCQMLGTRKPAVVEVNSRQATVVRVEAQAPVQEQFQSQTLQAGQFMTLAECVAIGRSRNPRILAARMEIASLAERVPQARALPDPMADIMYMVFDTPVQTAAGPQDYGLAMSQQIPVRAKRETRAAMAEQEVCAARARLNGIEIDVITKIRETYFELDYLQEALRITVEDRDRLEQIAEVVLQMYEVKRSIKQSDVLQIEIVRSQLDTTLAGLRQQLRSTQAKLARLMQLPPESTISVMVSGDSPQLLPDTETLFQMAIQQRPELQEQLFRVRRDKQAVTLATLERIPDPTFGFNWIGVGSNGVSPVSNGNDSLMFNIGFNLPVYRRRIDAGIREARNMAQANTHSWEAMRDEATEEVVDIMAQISSLQETLQLLSNEILPAATRTLDQLIGQYQVNEVDFPQMIDGWRMVLQYQISEQRVKTDLQQTIARLARAVGALELSALNPAASVDGQ